ncbi:exodeoxyribonuclease VII large subunit [Streptococcus sp. 121]|uniref:exodeoxyribonuclease VII large subunit n=1 Tax=Streptococcus sp. 121 TaxID=2797637 RepID=UPI0018F080A1|nr:exodeoxyribonuclease VII large subunit [Streptococcus sp. 121]MBJ6746114.1 exodeoxyribonuclease VII large subunit [Streptococcus sp. 121]
MAEYLSVGTLTNYLKRKFDKDPYLERVFLTGQVSNFRVRPNHQYFSLKDDQAVIQATMWGPIFKKLPFTLEEGQQLNVVGRVQLYAPNGSYSILIEQAEPAGVGELALRFEQLKKELTQAGYFKSEHKQELPAFNRKIGVVTSQSGAVIQDIITTVNRRFPGLSIRLYPAKVQGEGAAEEIAAQIQKANQAEDLDVLIVGRGGGSMEDLWAFNEEVVVRAIFESRLPVISSVGHETDVTLADFVADKRAATPTAAAELATPYTKADYFLALERSQLRLKQVVDQQLKVKGERLERIQQSILFRQPERLYDTYLQKLDHLDQQLSQVLDRRLQAVSHRYQLLNQALVRQSPSPQLERLNQEVLVLDKDLRRSMHLLVQKAQQRFQVASDALLQLELSQILQRGYALVRKQERIVSNVELVQPGDSLSIQLQDGQLEVEVTHVQESDV